MLAPRTVPQALRGLRSLAAHRTPTRTAHRPLLAAVTSASSRSLSLAASPRPNIVAVVPTLITSDFARGATRTTARSASTASAATTKRTAATTTKRATASAGSRTKAAAGASKASTSARAKTTKKSTAATAAKPKPKAKASKAAQPKPRKLKSWEAIDETTGKLKPLPSETRPARRTPFILFITERFPVVKKESQFSTTASDGSVRVDSVKVMRHLAGEWRALPESQKRRYVEAYEAERAPYEAALERWQASLTPEDIARQNRYSAAQRRKGKKNQVRLRDPRKPIKPPTPFFEFLRELRESDESMRQGSVVDAARRAGEKWSAMTKEQKQPYEAKSQGAKDQYLLDMERYKKAAAAASA